MNENNSNQPKRSDRQPFNHLLEQIDSFFNDSFSQFHSLFNRRSIRVHTRETETSVVVEAELPGYKRDQIEIEIIGNQLRIIAKNRSTTIEKGKQSSNDQEQSYQTAERLITLPFTTSEKDTTAVLRDGILKIVIPKKNESRRFIDIYDDPE